MTAPVDRPPAPRATRPVPSFPPAQTVLPRVSAADFETWRRVRDAEHGRAMAWGGWLAGAAIVVSAAKVVAVVLEASGA